LCVEYLYGRNYNFSNYNPVVIGQMMYLDVVLASLEAEIQVKLLGKDSVH
jgi:hypothetical protein